MASLSTEDRRRARLVGRIAHINPFTEERIELERELLGTAFDDEGADWNRRPEIQGTPPNVKRVGAMAEQILDRCGKVRAGDRDDVEDLILFVLYQRHLEGFDRAMVDALEGREARSLAPLYDAFRADAAHFFGIVGIEKSEAELGHAFALFFQVRRAFANIFEWIIGVSGPAARLRERVWQSIFTHDLRRYRAVLFERMADFTTLVGGPSGTGKELVARAIGLSRYVPFDPESRSFRYDFAGSFSSLNLSALSPTLIESELFGHKRGSFTGAVGDRVGWLESCPPCGSVFLDEIGELDLSIQVKLLRVLESRSFSRLGETTVRRFTGKVVVASNLDLAVEMRARRFREDLYYRLCSDLVETPSLASRLEDTPEELAHLVAFVARKLAGEQAESLAQEVLEFVERSLGAGYAWPGNVRELEQCVRNVLIRREYRPTSDVAPAEPWDELVAGMRGLHLTADELLRRYCTWGYRKAGSYEGAAHALGLDRRTVKAKLDRELLGRWGGSAPTS